MAAWVPEMFHNFYFMKNHKIVFNSLMTAAIGKISTDLEFLEFKKIIDVGLTKFKNKQILFNKIIHIFLVTTKLFTRCNIPIDSEHKITLNGSTLMTYL